MRRSSLRRCPAEDGRRPGLVAAAHRAPLAHPLRPAAVDDRCGVVTQVAQHPPQAARVHARVLVVDRDLRSRRRSRVGRTSPPSPRRREVDVGRCVRSEHRTRSCERLAYDRRRNVRLAVLIAAPRLVAQVVATIDDGPARRRGVPRVRRWRSGLYAPRMNRHDHERTKVTRA